jgi:hypothetical protein
MGPAVRKYRAAAAGAPRFPQEHCADSRGHPCKERKDGAPRLPVPKLLESIFPGQPVFHYRNETRNLCAFSAVWGIKSFPPDRLR